VDSPIGEPSMVSPMRCMPWRQRQGSHHHPDAKPRLLRVVRQINLAAGDNRRRRCAPLSDVKHLIGHGDQ
jgi:hypothetical protein